MKAPSLSRREFVHSASALAAVLALPGVARAHDEHEGKPAAATRKRALRIAHLTDMHVQPERKGDQGFTACLRHLRAQKDPADLILFGGDTVFDSFDENESRTRMLWELWQKLLKDECGTEHACCIGNHDIWGWNKSKSGTSGSEARYGKRWVLEIFGVEKPWRSFDKGGWHFIILDSTQPDGGDGYIAKLDDEQFEWLQGDLAATPATTPVLILSHIPILSAAAYMGNGAEKSGNWVVSGSVMHRDARRLKNLCRKHANVKLACSGHLHLVDRVDYLGVSYLCNGAVSGGWWKGANQECEPGYAMIDLFADGGFESQYVEYGWKAAADA
ncbi:3',5'-cyclic adenosine monophosphate phosphodiesterase CpdA [Phycisphaerae bacterium RAS1]|nr:3',5'-cyclic adenosine monophosphate phosphodiesterase CpdA [Phycisphaerae bacterium RAS1]